jgi:leader peptidase (prepilin peptidase)/N-methyltransferase
MITTAATEHGPYFPLFVFMVGACIGSFLNVIICRVPAGESVVLPGSHCTCGRPIPWYLNLPILSWLMIAGKAKCCGRPVSVRYFLVELITAVSFVAAWEMLAPGKAFVGCMFIFILIGASFIDLDTMEVPDVFSVGGAIIGVAAAFCLPLIANGREGLPVGWFFAQQACGAGIIAAGMLFWVATFASFLMRREALGLGDVKLLGAIGVFCGWQGAIFAMFGGAVVGIVWYTAIGISRTLRGAPDPAGISDLDEPASADTRILPFGVEVPFGPMLAIAGAVYYLLWNSHFAHLLPRFIE